MTSAASEKLTLESALDTALGLYNAGRVEAARALFREIDTGSPNTPEVLVGLGMATLSCGDITEAEKCLRRATQLNDRHDVAFRCLSIALMRHNDLAEAERAASQALQIAPGNAQNAFTLGLIKAARGKDDEAVACYKSAINLNPHYPEALFNVGSIALQHKDYPAAIEYLTSAVAIKPLFIEAYWKLFEALRDSGSAQEARALIMFLADIAPQSKEITAALALMTSSARDDEADTVDTSSLAATASPPPEVTHLEALTNRFFETPLVIDSAPELYEARDNVMDFLEHIQSTTGVIEDPYSRLHISPHFLSSLPLRDRLARSKLASVLSLKAPSLNLVAGHISTWKSNSPLRSDAIPITTESLGERDFLTKAKELLHRKVRLGICMSSLESCAPSSLFAGLCAALPTDLFDITIFHSTPPNEMLNETFTARADTALLDNSLQAAASQIEKSQLDILMYTDLESSRLTYLLAFARLAPVQCVLWVGTETTGIPTIDYFMTSHDLVGGRAQSQFSEYLVTFSTLAASCAPSQSSPVPGRGALGLPIEGTMFICPEYAESIHPGMDYIVERIIQGDRNSFVVFPDRTTNSSSNLITKRLHRLAADSMDQILVAKASTPRELVQLVEMSDVVLDPIYNSSPLPLIKALQSKKPVVTLPSKSLRGRAIGTCYRQAGCSDTIAQSVEHYIQIALLAARDTGWRNDLKEKSFMTYQVLSQQVPDASLEFGRFFLLAMNKLLSPKTPKNQVYV